MSLRSRKKIIRLLGVGFDAEDGHTRISHGEKFDVLMGSEESHEYITQLIVKVEEEINRRCMKLEDLTPGELGEIVQAVI